MNKMKMIETQPVIAEKWMGTDPIICEGKTSLLIVGDSLSRRLAFGINTAQQESNSAEYQLLVYVVLIFGFADQATLVINGVKIRIPSKEFKEVYFTQFAQLVQFFKKQNIQIYMKNTANNSHDSTEKGLNKYSDAMNEVFDKAVKQPADPDIKVIDIRSLLSNGIKNTSPSTINSIVMYDYTNHPSYYGAEFIGKYILIQLG